jgi:sec-independent protein translocase protein TatA
MSLPYECCQLGWCYNPSMALLYAPGIGELVVILLIVLVIVGGKNVPQLMRGLGQGVREYKKAVSDDDGKVQPAAPTDKESAEKKA